MPAVLGALGLREAVLRQALAPRDGLGRLLDVLADREAILVLDNCEHLIAGAAGARRPRCSPAARSCGSWPRAARRWRSPARASSPVPPLAQTPALTLFADRARGRASRVRDRRRTRDEICRRLDGLPLALELAAARLRTLPVGELAERLDDRFRAAHRRQPHRAPAPPHAARGRRLELGPARRARARARAAAGDLQRGRDGGVGERRRRRGRASTGWPRSRSARWCRSSRTPSRRATGCSRRSASTGSRSSRRRASWRRCAARHARYFAELVGRGRAASCGAPEQRRWFGLLRRRARARARRAAPLRRHAATRARRCGSPSPALGLGALGQPAGGQDVDGVRARRARRGRPGGPRDRRRAARAGQPGGSSGERRGPHRRALRAGTGHRRRPASDRRARQGRAGDVRDRRARRRRSRCARASGPVGAGRGRDLLRRAGRERGRHRGDGRAPGLRPGSS